MSWLEIDDGPDWSLDPLTLGDVKAHLRVTHDVEDAYITRLIRTSYRRAERVTLRAFIPQQRVLVLPGFPCGAIVLPHPPCLSVDDVTYIDANGQEQTLSGSPAAYDVSLPSGPTAARAQIAPVYGTTWPTTRSQLDAVRVTFTAGYPLMGSPAVAEIPEDILHGRLLVIAEMYKQRTESITGQGLTTNPAVLRARELWRGYTAY